MASMKKVFLILSLLAMMPGVAMAIDKQHDPVRNIDATCRDSGGWPPNTRIFCNFPQTRWCKSQLFSDKWSGCYDTFCPNFNAANFNKDTMIPEGRSNGIKASGTDKPTGTTCWAFVCNPGTVMYNSTCISTADCISKPNADISADGTTCINSNWCSDQMKTAFNANKALYTSITTSNGCSTLQCVSGYCMASATDPTCKPVDIDGTFGGTYTDPKTFLCAPCDPTSYVDGSASKCTQAPKANRAQMRACFDCALDLETFKTCITTGTKPTTCPSSNVTVN